MTTVNKNLICLKVATQEYDWGKSGSTDTCDLEAVSPNMTHTTQGRREHAQRSPHNPDWPTTCLFGRTALGRRRADGRLTWSASC